MELRMEKCIGEASGRARKRRENVAKSHVWVPVCILRV